ncbi:MAG: 30S ribosomal protein S20 [Deltaproteobacteria bacterium]
MANHESAIKRHKQSEKKKLRNRSVKSAVRTAAKKVKEAAAANRKDDATALLKNAISLLDGAVTKGVLHRNNASRRISRLTGTVNSASSK